MANQNLEKIDMQYNKIKGWLILIAVILIFILIYSLIGLAHYLSPFSSPEMPPGMESISDWSAMTNPESELYTPMYKPLIIFGLTANVALFVFSLIVVVLFFQKRKLFRFMAILLFISNLIIYTIEYSLFSLMSGKMEFPIDPVISLILCLILLPYLLTSKRAKETFKK